MVGRTTHLVHVPSFGSLPRPCSGSWCPDLRVTIWKVQIALVSISSGPMQQVTLYHLYGSLWYSSWLWSLLWNSGHVWRISGWEWGASQDTATIASCRRVLWKWRPLHVSTVGIWIYWLPPNLLSRKLVRSVLIISGHFLFDLIDTRRIVTGSLRHVLCLHVLVTSPCSVYSWASLKGYFVEV